MKIGRWLEPRHTSRQAYEKDFPAIDMHGMQIYCPGCHALIRLARKSPNGKISGWCSKCNRGVTA